MYLAHGPPCPAHCAKWRVLVIGSDGTRLQQVALNARAPAWSPDGRSLAYQTDLDSSYEPGSVTITRLDGSTAPVRVKAISPDYDVGPVWSPKGGEVAFQASLTQGARTWIYVARADGQRKGRLARRQDPAWSPDGRRLAFIDDAWKFGRSGRWACVARRRACRF